MNLSNRVSRSATVERTRHGKLSTRLCLRASCACVLCMLRCSKWETTREKKNVTERREWENDKHETYAQFLLLFKNIHSLSFPWCCLHRQPASFQWAAIWYRRQNGIHQSTASCPPIFFLLTLPMLHPLFLSHLIIIIGIFVFIH